MVRLYLLRLHFADDGNAEGGFAATLSVQVVPPEAAPGTAVHAERLASSLTLPLGPWKKHAWQEALEVAMTWKAKACSEWNGSSSPRAAAASQSGGRCSSHAGGAGVRDELLPTDMVVVAVVVDSEEEEEEEGSGGLTL